jgi:polyhydroxyalkanoate synthesis regulator phasin
MSHTTIEKLKRVLMIAIEYEATMENIRQTVQKSIPINLRTVFDALDWLKRGYLTSSEFRRYFDDYPDEAEQMRHGGPQALQAQMEGLIRRFNKDKLNGRVSLPEFMDELTPKCARDY